jgi:hypothetical protein
MATDVANVLNKLAEVSRRIKSQEPPAITPVQKQAAIVMATLEKELIDLIMEHMTLKIIFASLFYFWITLEAPLRGVSVKALDNWSMPLPEAIERIIDVIKATLEAFPDHKPTTDMKKLGVRVNIIKSLVPDSEIDRELSPDELRRQVTIVNTRIHTTMVDFFKQSFHPEIIANVLLGYWIRVSTMNRYVPESYYQKMEYYFDDIRKAVRAYLPTLFQ